ncbi:SDR family NAD(P)-dependent oxidoreductase [Kribbella sp. VKM Ac-2566]|uniref:SDR family NAD(P)-dependent oxidoreductase n=1 Tax=Kribbella sp. VKM Ac-2566 TaxID=2512218 RepID=UPI0010CFE43E|nr:SDR family NAD(P)-dependent oxidoreductase [Kribbella sp. VKM Ac-2566]TDX03910.1 short-subunit dehydrogenase [Kribbella sp. VKM Ac-2566]
MQTILITGATDGLGRELALRLGTAGARVLIHGRDAARAERVRADIRAAGGPEPEILLADLADLHQVDKLADSIDSELDVLVNNAGIGGGRPGTGREVSADGIELRFAVNYLAGYHLTRRLLPRLTSTGRIVNVASAGQQAIDFEDPMMERGWDGFSAYQRSKLAQIMFTIDLAAEQSVVVNALHPATFMATTMVTESGVSPISSVAEGADATMRLITAPDVPTGRYFNGLREARANEQAYDAHARERLRTLSDNLITTALR